MTYQVIYSDKKGAGCSRYFTNESDLEFFVSRLRREARILKDGNQIGEIFRSDTADDRRIKWLWCFESDEREHTV